MNKALTDRAEDYLRAVYEIIQRKGYARMKDIARELGVQPSSAVEMMKKLDQAGLVAYEKYGPLSLTSQGKETAGVITSRHQTFTKFLGIILVPKEVASRDAHVLEHRLHPKTILQFTRFVEFVTSAPEHPRFVGKWLEHFKEYCEEETRGTLGHND